MISRVPSHRRREESASSPFFSKVRVWITCTVLSPEQATNKRPSGARTMSFGRTPTLSSRSFLLLWVSTTLTLRAPQLLT